ETELDVSLRNYDAIRPGEELITLALAGPGPLAGLRGTGSLCETLDIKHLVMSEIETGAKLRDALEELAERGRELHFAREDANRLREMLRAVQATASWRLTRPLRAASALARRRSDRQERG